MSMIEMFDPQFYLQMYRELQAIAPELEEQAVREEALQKAKEQERIRLLHKRYDAAIRRARAKQVQKWKQRANAQKT